MAMSIPPRPHSLLRGPAEWSVQQLRENGEAYPASFFVSEAAARDAFDFLGRILPHNTRILRDPLGATVDATRARLGS